MGLRNRQNLGGIAEEGKNKKYYEVGGFTSIRPCPDDDV